MAMIRELTRKGDPMLRIQLPEQVLNALQTSAKSNKRRIQDEFVKRLAASFKHEADVNLVIQRLLPDLKELYS